MKFCICSVDRKATVSARWRGDFCWICRWFLAAQQDVTPMVLLLPYSLVTVLRAGEHMRREEEQLPCQLQKTDEHDKKKSLFISRYVFVAPSCHSATSFFVCIKSIRKLSMLTVLPASVPVLTSILCPQKNNNQGKTRDWSHIFSMLPPTWRLCLCSGWKDYC